MKTLIYYTKWLAGYMLLAATLAYAFYWASPLAYDLYSLLPWIIACVNAAALFKTLFLISVLSHSDYDDPTFLDRANRFYPGSNLVYLYITIADWGLTYWLLAEGFVFSGVFYFLFWCVRMFAEAVERNLTEEARELQEKLR